LLDAAHQRPGGLFVLVWNNLNAHVSRAMGERSRPDWLTVFQLPAQASGAQPGRVCLLTPEEILASLARRDIAQLTALGRNPSNTTGFII
jgi:putative transposase